MTDPSTSPLEGETTQRPWFDELDWVSLPVPHASFPAEHAPRLAVLNLNEQRDAKLFYNSVQLAFEDRSPERVASGMGQRIGGWIATAADVSELANYWASMIVQYDKRERAYALRFYDSRSIALLWPLLSDGQRQVLLGPVGTWHTLDACARPCVYQGGVALHAHLQLKETQWEAIRAHEHINRALGLMMLDEQRQPLPRDIEIAVEAAQRYEAYDIEDAADRALFILHALTWHPRFDMHPVVRHAMRAIGPDTFYSEALSVLSDSDISAIRQSSL
ncbi:DUF4123 domain-containing protein [Robbsia sp. KACC 23696]|uniref:DUF4123 domain-containing protein n=1 Tax=Robbsia sp. KACC 23696 TaxID=3149231 RepID=UPI00325B5BCD